MPATRPHALTRSPVTDVVSSHPDAFAAQADEIAPVPVSGLVQRRETGDELGGTTAAPEVSEALTRRRGGGRAMAPEVSQRMGEAMGVDVSGVRIHDDAEADTIARSVQSVAFAQGTDLYFTQGSYSPGTPSGDHLLAHELAHTTQQSSGSGGPGPAIGHADDPAEAAADQVADGAVARLRRQATRVEGAAAPGPKVAGADEVRRWPWSKKKTAPTKADDQQDAQDHQDQPQDGVQEKAEETEQVAGPDVAPDVAPDPEADDATWSGPTVSPNPTIKPELLERKLFAAGTKLRKHNGKKWRSSGVLNAPFTAKVVDLDSTYYEVESGGTRYALPKAAAQQAEHVKETDPVFALDADGKPTRPRPEDVVQGALGDCYLEAALAALARTSPDTIIAMIRDLGDHVTVRFHDVDRSDPAKPSFTPRYVKVEKSRVKRGSTLIYDEGALWVGMIEKAYAAGRFAGNAEKTTAARAKGGDTAYEDIAGGRADYAFEVLLGKPATHTKVAQGEARDQGGDSAGLPWRFEDTQEYARQKKKLFGASYTGLAASTVYGKDTKKLHAWFKWLDKVGDDKITDLYKSVLKDASGYKHAAIRVEDLTLLFKTHGLDAELADPMLKYLERYFPGKRGTGSYSEDNLRIYTSIRDAVLADKSITVGSHDSVGRSSSGVGHSGGEEKAKGMVGSHVFTVLSTKTDPKSGVRYIQVRNPWGSYGREYDAAHKPKAVEDGNGESWIELGDFVKRFDALDVA